MENNESGGFGTLTIEFYLNGILFLILFFSAIKDWKEHIIPNVYLVRGVAIRALLLPHEVSLDGTEAIKRLGIKVGISAIIFILGILIRKLTKDGIGMGDIKLCALMFLYLEANVWFGSLFVSLILGAIHAFIVTVGKKERGRIPFSCCFDQKTMMFGVDNLQGIKKLCGTSMLRINSGTAYYFFAQWILEK